jgi:hypothetical protein
MSKISIVVVCFLRSDAVYSLMPPMAMFRYTTNKNYSRFHTHMILHEIILRVERYAHCTAVFSSNGITLPHDCADAHI